MMVPVGRLVVLRTTPKPKLMEAFAILTWPALAAPILAPPLGGFITTYASWPWIFFINLPLGLIGLALAARIVPPLDGASRRPFDGTGFVLTGLATLCFMTAAEALGRQSIDWPLTGAALVVSLGLGAAAVRHAFRQPQPLLDLSGFAVPTFSVSLVGGSLFRIAVSTVPFLLPLMFQVGFGLDAFRSGLLVLALFVGNMAIKPATSPIIRRFGFRRTLVGNGLLFAATVLLCATLRPATPLPLLLLILVLSGMTRSMGLTAINTIAFADIPEPRMNGANVLFNMLQQMSLGLGIAFGGLALRFAEIFRPLGATAATLPEFSIAFGLVSLVALLSVLDAMALPSDAGATVAGSRP
jgi:MFS family permease